MWSLNSAGPIVLIHGLTSQNLTSDQLLALIQSQQELLSQYAYNSTRNMSQSTPQQVAFHTGPISPTQNVLNMSSPPGFPTHNVTGSTLRIYGQPHTSPSHTGSGSSVHFQTASNQQNMGQNSMGNENIGASSHLNDSITSLGDIFNMCIYLCVSVDDGHSIPVTNTGRSILPTPMRPLHLNNVLITPYIVKN
ncbi:hypothetical protein Tco_0765939 [Tanacetum coccineum]